MKTSRIFPQLFNRTLSHVLGSAGVLVAALFFALSPARAATPPTGFVLEVEMADPKGGSVQLFANTGYGYNQHDSATASLPPGDNLTVLRFNLPAAPIKHLRLDPALGEATVRIGQWRLLTSDGRLLVRFGPEHLRPMFDIRSLTLENGIATVHTGSTDPMLLVDEPLHALTHRELGRRSLGTTDVVASGAALALALLIGFLAALRTATGRWARPALLCFAGVFLVVLGSRLYWLSQFSRPMPFWDEWESDALYLLIPFQGGFLDWQALVIPQSEHRIVVTRFITLLGTLLNGEWDPRLGMVAGSAMLAATLGLAAAVALQAGRWIGAAAAVAIAATAVLPFDQSNLLWGGQSQMYALNFLAACVLIIAASSHRTSVTWMAGLCAGAASLGTMGAGFVAPGIAAGICFVRISLAVERRHGLGILMLAFVAATVAGLLWREASHWHEPTYAHSWGEFWTAFKAFAAWPLPGHTGTLVVAWLPWIVLATMLFARRVSGPPAWVGFGLGAWALVAAIGLAHGRPQLALPMDSKYFTALSFAALASVLATAALLEYLTSVWARLMLIAATAAVVAGMIVSGFSGIAAARQHHWYWDQQDPLVYGFLAGTDRAALLNAGPSHAPYWNAAELAERLDSPLLQPLLPAELRARLNHRPGVHFDPNPGPLTRAALGAMKVWWLISAAGLAALAAALLRRPRPQP